uniref:Uncharacterized protein n=1 Tax=Timema bartmani TaxID=61472 RepID=A0A7R9I6D5_9NEOP|nr:unnamed protein product [Timema bartmani]
MGIAIDMKQEGCSSLIQMERTSRGKFEGGDAAWEEERLQSYSTSEVRLIEIQENLCTDIKDGINQCHFLAEENEQLLEEWWFSKQMEEPDLFKFLCINTLKHCCPDNHYGTECKACPGFPDNVCNKSGKCKRYHGQTTNREEGKDNPGQHQQGLHEKKVAQHSSEPETFGLTEGLEEVKKARRKPGGKQFV